MGPPPSPPGGGGGGGGIPPSEVSSRIPCFPRSCQDYFQKRFSKKTLTSPSSSEKITPMNKKWIPRSLRWTDAERQEKKLQSQNARQIRWMFWRESQALREQIQKEISAKLIAKREAIE